MKLSLPEPDLAPAGGEQWRQMIRDEQQQWLDERGGVSLSDDQRKLAFYQAAVAVGGELRERVAQLPAEQVRGEASMLCPATHPRSRWWWVQHAAVVLAFVAVIGWFYFNQDTVVLWEYVPAGGKLRTWLRKPWDTGGGLPGRRWSRCWCSSSVLPPSCGSAKARCSRKKAIQYWRTALGMALCALCTGGVFVLACTIYAFYTDLA